MIISLNKYQHKVLRENNAKQIKLEKKLLDIEERVQLVKGAIKENPNIHLEEKTKENKIILEHEEKER